MTTPGRVADVDTPAAGPSETSETQVQAGHGHDVDRALAELLGEIRIAQMGAQILLGFLLAVAYTAALRDASASDRALYAWAVGVTTGAVVLLLANVPLHRLNFGRRARPEILVVGHVLAVTGLALLAGAIVLSVWMAARIADPSMVGVLVIPVTGLLVVAWIALPLGLRLWSAPPAGPPQG
jgi:hypothetical protein